VTRTARYVLPTTHYLGDQIREMGRECSTYGEKRDDTGNWPGGRGGGPEGKELFGKHVYRWNYNIKMDLNPLNPELNPIRYLLALLAHYFLHVSRIRVKSLTIRLLMSYIYIYIYIYIYMTLVT